jgi:hypothetical protein
MLYTTRRTAGASSGLRNGTCGASPTCRSSDIVIPGLISTVKTARRNGTPGPPGPLTDAVHNTLPTTATQTDVLLVVCGITGLARRFRRGGRRDGKRPSLCPTSATRSGAIAVRPPVAHAIHNYRAVHNTAVRANLGLGGTVGLRAILTVADGDLGDVPCVHLRQICPVAARRRAITGDPLSQTVFAGAIVRVAAP